MELKSGYKQTEVGVIPGDWQTPTLESLTTLMTNGFVGTATTHYADNEKGILYIQGYNVQENSFNFHGIKFVTEDFHAAHAKSCLRTGDLLTVQTGDVGLTTVVPEELAGSNCHALIISRFDQNNVCPDFVSYYLNSLPGRSRLRLIETGTTMKHLNVGDMLQFRVPLPASKTEQKAIAEVLRDTDAVIKSVEQLIAKKRLIKQGAMQELLTGKNRLPGFYGEWAVKALGEVGDSLIGLTYSPRDVHAAGVLVLRSSNIFEGTLRFEDNVYVEMDIPERIMVKQGDILICVRNGSRDLIGKCAQIDQRAKGMTFGAFMAVFRTPYHGFVYHQFQSDLIKRQIREHLGATINQITNKNLNSFRVPFPLDMDEQGAIASVLNDMDAEVVALEERLFKIRQIKGALIQELLTGRIRLV